MLVERHEDAGFMASIGATTPCHTRYLFEGSNAIANAVSDDNSNDPESDDEVVIHLNDDDALDEYMASETHLHRPKGVSSETLSKIWHIDLDRQSIP